MFFSALQSQFIHWLPLSLQLPSRYYYSKFTKKLEPEIQYLQALVGSSARAIDVGANRGHYTFALSQLCEAVEVFEPQQWAIAMIQAYGADHIHCHNVGLSAQNGNLDLHIPTRANTVALDALASFRPLKEPHRSIQVPVRRLDDYQFDDVSFIKIDVEGYEYEVLEGAKETILRCQPNLLVEIEQRHLQDRRMEDVFEKILAFGYRGMFLHRGCFRPLAEFAYEQYQKPFLNEINQNRRVSDYVNNFIFESLDRASKFSIVGGAMTSQFPL